MFMIPAGSAHNRRPLRPSDKRKAHWHGTCKQLLAGERIMRGHKGFSLVELMVVLGILAVLASVAMINMIAWTPKQRLLSAVSDVQGAINLARMAAIKENTHVVILFNTPAHGFTVFVDSDDDQVKDAGERILRRAGFANDINVSSGFSGNKVSFDGRGLPSTAANVTLQNATAGTKTIQVTVTGNSRML
jgi:prepilin-type N-terminal cleavage/methylation domain-containing protein